MKLLLKLGVVAIVNVVPGLALSQETHREACSRYYSDCLDRVGDSQDRCETRCGDNLDCQSGCDSRAEEQNNQCESNLDSCREAAEQEEEAWQQLENPPDSGQITRFGAPTNGGWEEWNRLMGR